MKTALFVLGAAAGFILTVAVIGRRETEEELALLLGGMPGNLAELKMASRMMQ